ncbi:hypothetical protein Q9L58_001170 [Maublancomyces gigas]|uniref:Uncharacterized protein n=1 Tax=Discina gigas TaxID=1032678 RepID=A0ABR3GV90_9PEZI
MLDQLFSWPRTADTGVGSVHGDGSSDLPISNCISGELGGVGMSIGYCTSSSPSVPTIITIVTPAKPISEDFLSDSLISVVPTRLEPEEEASSTQTSTRTFTAGGFLAAIFGIGIALSFWTPKNLWVFMGGFGFRRERRRQKNRQQQRAVAAAEVAVEGNKLTNGQKDKGKARAIYNETEEGESSKSTASEQTALLIGGPATYSSDIILDNPRDSGIDLTSGEEARVTRPEKLSIHPEPIREPELSESDMLKTIDEEEEIDSWTFGDHQPSPIPSPRIRSPAPRIEPEPPVTHSQIELETVGHGASYPFNRDLSVAPLPTADVIDAPVTNGYGRKQPGGYFSLDKSTVLETEPPASEWTPKLNIVEKRVEVPVKVEEERVEMPLEVEVEEEVKAKVGESKAGPSVSTEVEVPTVEEVIIPAIVAVETLQAKEVEAPKKVETPKVERVETPEPIEAPKVKEVETPQVELVKAPRVEPVESLKVEKVDTPKVEPKVEPVEAPKVEPRVEPVESPKVELVETPKIEIPEPKKVETPKVETPKAEAVVERLTEDKKVEVPKAEVVVERPAEVKKVEVAKAEAIVERPAEDKVEVKAEVVVERPVEVKKVEVAKSAPVALIVPSTPQIELIPPTPAFNSSFSEEAEEFSKERAEGGEEAVEVNRPATLPDVEEEEEPVVPTKAAARSMTSEQVRSGAGSLIVENNHKEDDDMSIIGHPISHSPDQISLSGGDQEEEEPTIKSGLTADETPRPGSSRAPSIIGDDNKSTKSGRRGFRRMASLGRDRSVDSLKKDKLPRRSLTSSLTGKKSKKDGSVHTSASTLQAKLGELTPPPTPPETSQDAARPESRRSEKERRSMSWSNATSKILSKEKRDQAKKSSDSEATGAADATHAVDEVETAETLKSSSASVSTSDRPTTSDGGKSKIPRGKWFSKKKSSSNLSIADVAKAASTASLAAAKHETTQSTTDAVTPVDKGKGIDRIPVEEAPTPTESIKVIDAPPPPPPVEEEQKLSGQAVEPTVAAAPASDRPKAPRLKSGVMSVMAWGRKKK